MRYVRDQPPLTFHDETALGSDSGYDQDNAVEGVRSLCLIFPRLTTHRPSISQNHPANGQLFQLFAALCHNSVRCFIFVSALPEDEQDDESDSVHPMMSYFLLPFMHFFLNSKMSLNHWSLLMRLSTNCLQGHGRSLVRSRRLASVTDIHP